MKKPESNGLQEVRHMLTFLTAIYGRLHSYHRLRYAGENQQTKNLIKFFTNRTKHLMNKNFKQEKIFHIGIIDTEAKRCFASLAIKHKHRKHKTKTKMFTRRQS